MWLKFAQDVNLSEYENQYYDPNNNDDELYPHDKKYDLVGEDQELKYLTGYLNFNQVSNDAIFLHNISSGDLEEWPINARTSADIGDAATQGRGIGTNLGKMLVYYCKQNNINKIYFTNYDELMRPIKIFSKYGNIKLFIQNDYKNNTNIIPYFRRGNYDASLKNKYYYTYDKENNYGKIDNYIRHPYFSMVSQISYEQSQEYMHNTGDPILVEVDL